MTALPDSAIIRLVARSRAYPERRGSRGGTENIYEAARLAGVERVVFASSHHDVGYYPRRRRLEQRALVLRQRCRASARLPSCDRAEDHAAEVLASVPPEDESKVGTHVIGGHFANGEYEGPIERVQEW